MEQEKKDLQLLSDEELFELVAELQKNTWDDDNIVRKLAIQLYGSDTLTNIMFIANKLLPIVAERMRVYSNMWHPAP